MIGLPEQLPGWHLYPRSVVPIVECKTKCELMWASISRDQRLADRTLSTRIWSTSLWACEAAELCQQTCWWTVCNRHKVPERSALVWWLREQANLWQQQSFGISLHAFLWYNMSHELDHLLEERTFGELIAQPPPISEIYAPNALVTVKCCCLPQLCRSYK